MSPRRKSATPLTPSEWVIARLFVLDDMSAKEIAAAYGDMAVSVPMRGGILDLKWSDVFIDGTKLRIFSSSVSPSRHLS